MKTEQLNLFYYCLYAFHRPCTLMLPASRWDISHHLPLVLRRPQFLSIFCKWNKIKAGAPFWPSRSTNKPFLGSWNPCSAHSRAFLLFFLFCFFFFFSRAAPMAYGGSQARGWIGAVAMGLHHSQQHGIQAASLTYATAHGNAGSLIHWMRSGIKPKTSWFLVGFVSTAPWQELW